MRETNAKRNKHWDKQILRETNTGINKHWEKQTRRGNKQGDEGKKLKNITEDYLYILFSHRNFTFSPLLTALFYYFFFSLSL